LPGFYHFIIGISLLLILVLRTQLKSSNRKQINIITFTLGLVLVMELIGFYTARQRINNTLLYNLGWIYLESYLLIAYFYSLEKSLLWRKRIIQLSILLLIWGVTNSLFFEPLYGALQFFSLLPYGLSLILLSIRLLYQLLNLEIYSNQNLPNIPHFWISSIILFFYLEAIFLFGTYQFHPSLIVENVRVFFTINKMMAGLMYLMFGLAFIFPHLPSLFNNKKSGPVYS
jgi:hypothetical protein